MLEDEFEGRLHKTVWLTDGLVRFSVSRVNEILGYFFVVFWIILLAADAWKFTGSPSLHWPACLSFAWHAADEFVAMAALIEAGQSIEAIAARFGVPERHVKHACGSASSLPNCSTLIAPATSASMSSPPSPSAPITPPSWRCGIRLKENSYIQPYTVRRLLTQTAVPLDSDLGLFVAAPPMRPPAAR